MIPWILNNKLTSLLLATITTLLIYIGFQKFEIWSLDNIITEQNTTIEKQNTTINRIVKANHESNVTITELTKDVSVYRDQLKTQQTHCNKRVSYYKEMLKECQESFPETNSTVVTVNDCKIKIVETNSSTIKLLNKIGQ